MSQQINLLNPAFHKKIDWLSATPLAIATCVMLAIMGTASFWARTQADSREQEANRRADTLKVAQDRLLTITKSMAESKPNLQLANELANARAMLKSREDILKVLEGGTLGNTVGFAEFLRGLARQVPNGLWLTGFTIGAGGHEMEIRGRMLNPAHLPEYIRRLKNEKVFQGVSFASLTIQRPEEGREKKITATRQATTGRSTAPTSAMSQALPPKFIDFVLMPSAPDRVTPATANTPVPEPGLVDAKLLPSAITSPGIVASAPAASQPQAAEKKQ